MSKLEHVWVPKKEILLMGDRGAGSHDTSLRELSFFECKRCKIKVMKKGATPHKDCDECLVALVINEGEHYG